MPSKFEATLNAVALGLYGDVAMWLLWSVALALEILRYLAPLAIACAVVYAAGAIVGDIAGRIAARRYPPRS